MKHTGKKKRRLSKRKMKIKAKKRKKNCLKSKGNIKICTCASPKTMPKLSIH